MIKGGATYLRSQLRMPWSCRNFMLDNTDVDIKTNALVSHCYPPVKIDQDVPKHCYSISLRKMVMLTEMLKRVLC